MKQQLTKPDDSGAWPAARLEARRNVCTAFVFWTVCGPRCKRARRCAGDPRACFDRCWPHVPEDLKEWFRFALRARIDGMTGEQACRHATAEVERWHNIQREWAQDEAARGAPLAATEQAAEPKPERGDRQRSGPRIRRL